jgi:ABC-type transport system substrate-binding protein/class 3 adenylate cyclase/glutamine cyclotransferase
MPERPTGTVTFLFTDIEGSTRLLEQLRERYDEVLSTHARLLREAFAEYEGHEIDTQGDAFFVAFARARDAVAAAVAAQRAVAAEAWPDGGTVRVRMGLHTGEPLVGGERYVGMGVHRGARIAAAGHGGQVLLSNTTRELVEDELPDDVGLRDLGEHELKDLKRPEHLFQLEIDGLPSEFPALRTEQSSAFAGREGELTRAAQGVIRRRFTRRRTVVAGIAVALVAALVLSLVFALGGSAGKAVAANSVVALTPSGSVDKTVPVGARPVAMATGARSLWVANLDDKNVTRVDLASQKAVRAIPVGGAPTAVTANGNGVWVGAGSAVSKIDPHYNQVTETRQYGAPSGLAAADPSTPRPTLAAFGSIWAVHPDGYVVRIDPRSGRKLATIEVGNDPSAIAAGAGSVWVTNSSDGTATRIDPSTLVTNTISVGHAPTAIAVGDTGVWVANSGDNAIVHVDPETNAVTGTTRVGDGPTAVLATPTAVWVANGRDGTVMRLDPRSGQVDKTVHLGGTPDALATDGERVWVAVAPSPPLAARTGGVLHLTSGAPSAVLDPALANGLPSLFYATCANLVTYPDKPGATGSRIVPEVAEAVPTPTDGGKVYTFKIRPGFRFSPPSNEAVTAATFKATIERELDPRMKSPLAGGLSGIAGMGAHGNTLMIRLSRPDGGFPTTLASGGACAVPVGTPVDPGGINNISSAGPYFVASYTPRQQIVLRRNPNYHGDRPRRFDRLVVTLGVAPAQALQDVEAGTADYAVDGLPPGIGPRLLRQYGPGSEAAKAGHQRYFISPTLSAFYLHMNTSRPLFANVRLRRAVNYALDRPALVAEGHKYADTGPFNLGQASDKYIPLPIDGAPTAHVYPVDGPDLRQAKRLAGHLHTTAVMYTPNVPPWLQEAQIIRSNLRPLGIAVEVKQLPVRDFFSRIIRRGEPFDLAVSGWVTGGDPAGALATFGNSTFRAGAVDFSYFDDPSFDRQLEAAAKLSGPKRYRTYGKLELELERKFAPAAPFASGASRDFFSARIGCQVYQPLWGMDLGALCRRRNNGR